ncbi:MAG TPA: hypothetical protein P5572_16400 [Phycisphaerae bacterium]|nr:hypothetical protein [Phycisphaerae bacterium]
MTEDSQPNNEPSSAIAAEELRKALKAFKKRLKLARLDEESRLGRGAMSGGKRSGIVSIMPPNQYPQPVWDELVRLGRLRYVGNGLYEPVETHP